MTDESKAKSAGSKGKKPSAKARKKPEPDEPVAVPLVSDEEKARARQIASRYQTGVAVSLLSGLVLVIVSGVLIFNHFKGGTAKAFLDDKAQSRMKAELRKQPDNKKLKRQIRTRDYELRANLFQRYTFDDHGTNIIFVAALILLISLHFTQSLHKQLPDPKLWGPRDPVKQARLAVYSRFCVIGLGLFAGFFILMLGLGTAGLVFQSESAAAPPPDVAKAEPTDTKTPEPPAEPVAKQPQVPAATGTYPPTQEDYAKYWARFRGPGASGISAYTDVPATWNGKSGEGIIWKTEVPLAGFNSPVVWGDRIFLSGADKSKNEIFCFDANGGKLLWRTVVPPTEDSPGESPEVMDATGLAAPTMVTDGRVACAMFANGDVGAVDFNGKHLWTYAFGELESDYGHSASLEFAGGRVIAQADQAQVEDGLSLIAALDPLTGEPVWEIDREVPNSWSSPVLMHTDGGPQIVTLGKPWVIAYEPKEGEEIWRAKCLDGDVAPLPILAGGMVLAISPEVKILAIRPDGKGDVTDTHIAWSVEGDLPDVSSPVSDGKLVWALETYGTLNCFNVADGKLVWTHKLDDKFWPSPSLVGDKLYVLSDKGIMYILEAGAEYKELGRAELGEETKTTPAFQPGRIYIRGLKHLYCIGEKK